MLIALQRTVTMVFHACAFTQKSLWSSMHVLSHRVAMAFHSWALRIASNSPHPVWLLPRFHTNAFSILKKKPFFMHVLSHKVAMVFDERAFTQSHYGHPCTCFVTGSLWSTMHVPWRWIASGSHPVYQHMFYSRSS